MKIRNTFAVACMVGWVVVSAGAATADNPYEKIVARNLFGLKDPPPPAPTGPEKTPPPAISLQGFATILGKPQVLFKVAMPPKPPQPSVELSKVLTEGERDGEITVLEINMAERSAKFDNYGTVEVKNMKDHAAKPGGAPINVAGIPQPAIGQPGLPQPYMISGGRAVTSLPGGAETATTVNASTAGMSSRAATLQNSATRQPRTAGVATTGTPAPGQNWPPEITNLSPEEIEARIAIQQQLHANDPNFPTVPGSYVPDTKKTPPKDTKN